MESPEADSPQTCRLLEQARAGDRAAFEELFRAHRPQIRRFIDRRLDVRVRARLDPSDVVQDTQFQAFRRLDDYLRRRPMPFHIWLWKTARESLLKAHRRHLGAAQRAIGRETHLPDASSWDLAERFVAGGCSPSQHLSRQEVVRRVNQALGELAEIDREVLTLRTFEGLSFSEIACVLEIEAVTARKRYGRALLRLRSALLKSGLLEPEP